MMILQILSQDEGQVQEIADYLLKEELIANAMLSEKMMVKTKSANGTIVSSKQYKLQGISKSLLFQEINHKLKLLYGDNMPMLYSEPIILIDPVHQDAILNSIRKV